ncbi:hypothetical protein [Pseudomonas sp. GD03944]|uniref:hypothetical protein n=1 Tax=Pseudomonas sp. GD03944 TaxID=2975409 RepID=UPI00244D40DC|nr:hypothetical protein [Pseudomonas sp. GD03944]MDH1261625.1 hypothetical protein [Pseudomonas sp. GD03944]
MNFVNEYISKDDMDKFQIKDIDRRVRRYQRTNADTWTVDRESGTYLRCVARGGEDQLGESAWTFYWQGELLWIELKILDISSNGRNAPAWSHKKVMKLCVMGENSDHLSERLSIQKNRILEDLEAALLAYKDGGVYASATTYTFKLEVAEGV